MKIYSIYDAEFRSYGQIISGYDTTSIVDALNAATPLPEGVEYVASEPALESLPVAAMVSSNFYGGMPAQMGWCNGHNTKLNCLEYHRDSELNLGTEDFILLLAKQDEIVDGVLDTAKVKAFLCPANVLVEVYATSLHYAPCSAHKDKGFRVLIALPRGTNGEKPNLVQRNPEDGWLWGRNKWLIAHAQSSEASQGAYVGLTGENIDIKNLI